MVAHDDDDGDAPDPVECGDVREVRSLPGCVGVDLGERARLICLLLGHLRPGSPVRAARWSGGRSWGPVLSTRPRPGRSLLPPWCRVAVVCSCSGPASTALEELRVAGLPRGLAIGVEPPDLSWGVVTVPEQPSTHTEEEDLDESADGAARRRPGRAEAVVRRADKFQQRHDVLGFPYAVLQKFGNDQAGSKAALIAYYGLFAIFPLLMLFTTILGYVLRDNDQLRKDLVDSALGSFPIIGSQLQSQVHGLTGSALAVVVGSILLLYGAIGLGLATQSAMNKVWNIPYVRWPSLPVRYLRGFAVLVLLALSTIGSTVLTGFATLTAHGEVSTALLLVGSLALNFGLILIAYMVMTAVKFTWREVVTRSGVGHHLLAGAADHRELVRGSRAPACDGDLRFLRHRHRPGGLDLPRGSVLPPRRGDQRRQALPPLAQIHHPTPADRGGQGRLRAPGADGGASWRSQVEVDFTPDADFDPLRAPRVSGE